MTSTLWLLLIGALIVGVLVYVLRRSGTGSRRAFDAGAVSTQWLAELKRDEPWTRS